MQKHALWPALLWLALGCSGGGHKPSDLAQLQSWMSGSFSSAVQAAADTNFFDIRLEMHPIWSERSDGPWLYVEQAAAEYLDRPYRQRVYRLVAQEDAAIRSEVYTLPEPLRFAGDWRNKTPLAALTPDSLTLREGCAVVLRRQADGSFAGGTVGNGCESNLRGAAYATSEVSVWAARIVSWDRGFDAAGQQVWGAKSGGYIFEKVNAEANHE